MRLPNTQTSAGIDRKYLRIFVILCFCNFYLVPISQAQQEQEHKKSLREITQQIKKVSRNLNANKTLLKNERDKLAILEQQIADQQLKQRNSLAKITEHQTASKETEMKLEQLKVQQRSSIDGLKNLLLSRYKQGAPSYLQIVLNQQDPYAVGRVGHYYRYFSEAQADRLQQLKRLMSRILKFKEQIEEVGVQLVAERVKLERQSQELLTLQTERRRRVARLDKTVTTTSNDLKRLKRDRGRLNSLLAELAKQAARLQKLEQAKKLEQKRIRQPDRPKPVKGGFYKQRGRLSAPVVAKLEMKYGQRLRSSGMQVQGHFYRTKKDQEVTAVFRGNVLFADYLKGYGLLMIIDHGEDHISLYGNNEVLYKQVGDVVATGELVAKTRESGGQNRPGLYFEIRHQAVPVNPANWLVN